MARKKDKEVVTQDEEAEVLSIEELSKYIKQLSATTKKLLNNGYLNRRAMVLLIHDALPYARRGGQKICGRPQVEAVLETIEQLKDTYCP